MDLHADFVAPNFIAIGNDETGSKHLFLFYINNIDIVQTRGTYEAK
jgi:hypothetical protein